MAYNSTPFAKPGKGFICDLLGERRSIGQHNLDSIWEFLQQIHLYQYPSIGEPGHSCCGNVTMDWLPNHAAKFQKTQRSPASQRQVGKFHPSWQLCHVISLEVKELKHDFQNKWPAKNKVGTSTQGFKHF
jgi:hypothetical protein